MLITWIAKRSDEKAYVVRNLDDMSDDTDVCYGQKQVEDVIGCMEEEGVRAVVVEAL